MGKEYQKQIQVISTVPAPADVPLMEDFEGAFTWFIDLMGDGYARKEPAQSFLGSYGCILKSRTVGAAPGDEVTIMKAMPAIRGRYLEVSVRFKQKAIENAGITQFYLRVADYDFLTDYSIRYVPSTGKWQYADVAYEWQDIAPLTMRVKDGFYTIVKFVIDIIERKYVYVDIINQIASLEGKSAFEFPNADHEIDNRFAVGLTTEAAASADLAVDNIFVRVIPGP